MRRLLLVVAFLSQPLGAATDIVTLKDSVVRLSGSSDGAGIVVGADERTIFIATASHVVPAAEINVQFNAARHRTFAARVYRQTSVVDFAVVVVDMASDDPIRRSLRPLMYREGRVPLLTAVSNIGHGGDWWEVNFGVNKLQADELNVFVFSKVGVVQGASGGPLFDDQNRLIGMVTEVDAAKATALKLDAILSLLSSWNVRANFLGEQFCEVSIRSTPAGADVFKGDDRAGKTPMTLSIKEGWDSHVVLKKDLYETAYAIYSCTKDVDVRLIHLIPESVIGEGVTGDELALVLTASDFERWKTVDPLAQTIQVVETKIGRSVQTRYRTEALEFQSSALILPNKTEAAAGFAKIVEEVMAGPNTVIATLVTLGDQHFGAHVTGDAVRTSHVVIRQGKVIHMLEIALVNDGLTFDKAAMLDELFKRALRASDALPPWPRGSE